MHFILIKLLLILPFLVRWHMFKHTTKYCVKKTAQIKSTQPNRDYITQRCSLNHQLYTVCMAQQRTKHTNKQNTEIIHMDSVLSSNTIQRLYAIDSVLISNTMIHNTLFNMSAWESKHHNSIAYVPGNLNTAFCRIIPIWQLLNCHIYIQTKQKPGIMTNQSFLHKTCITNHCHYKTCSHSTITH